MKGKRIRQNRDIIKFCILAGLLAALYLAGMLARGRGGADDSGNWIYSRGIWQYEKDGMPIQNRWVDGHDYFVDESGTMVCSEWIYQWKETGAYGHSASIPVSDFDAIDMDRLCYVGSDGRIIRKKNIYFTPFRFDSEGFCSISAEDLDGFEGLEYGIEGLRRYVILHDGYKEYY